MTLHLLAFVLATGLAQHRRPPGPPPHSSIANSQMSDADIRSQVEAYVGTIDTPISAEQWKTLGPRATPLLKKIALSSDELPSRRAHALSGWSIVGNSDDAPQITSLAQSSQEPFVVRLAAVHATGRLLPAEKLLPALKPVLETEKDERLRKSAAEVLTLRAPEASCAVVLAQAQRETRAIRRQFHLALKQCPQ